jgi:hypothetical protein
MNVKGKGCYFPQCPDDGRANGQIGDKVAIHDIKMDPIRPGLFDRFDFFRQAAKISGENGGSNFFHGVSSLQGFSKFFQVHRFPAFISGAILFQLSSPGWRYFRVIRVPCQNQAFYKFGQRYVHYSLPLFIVGYLLHFLPACQCHFFHFLMVRGKTQTVFLDDAAKGNQGEKPLTGRRKMKKMTGHDAPL